MRTFLVPYAYEYVKEGVTGGTTERCDAILAARTDHKATAVLTAGFSKQNPTTPSKKHRSSLAQQQAEYISKKDPSVRCIVSPLGWGTLDETRHAIELISQNTDLDSNVEVLVSSNPWHLYGRVFLCWWRLKPRHWKIRFVPVHHNYTWKERFQEVFLKIPFYLMQSCFW